MSLPTKPYPLPPKPTMPKSNAKPLSVESLWEIERLSGPALSPDGSQVVCARTCYDKSTNKTSSQLWLLSTFGGAPRALTTCGDKDQQAAWSPHGDRIAFIAKRERAGQADATAQLYVIAPDGGEATSVSDIAAGIEAFKWMPDGKHIVCIAWVWPELKGLKAQNRQHKSFSERKESGYVTSEGYYRYWDHNLPMGRVVHLLRVNIETGHTVDLFEGSDFELPRADLSAEMFDISPDGKRIVFMCDAANEKRASNRHALFELTIANRKINL